MRSLAYVKKSARKRATRRTSAAPTRHQRRLYCCLAAQRRLKLFASVLQAASHAGLFSRHFCGASTSQVIVAISRARQRYNPRQRCSTRHASSSTFARNRERAKPQATANRLRKNASKNAQRSHHVGHARAPKSIGPLRAAHRRRGIQSRRRRTPAAARRQLWRRCPPSDRVRRLLL